MKNRKKQLGNLKLHKNVIANFNSNSIVGGGSQNTNCPGCLSYDPNVACEDPNTDIRYYPATSPVFAACNPSLRNDPDYACYDPNGDVRHQTPDL